MRAIDRIGIELEGCWENENMKLMEETGRGEKHHDGSVNQNSGRRDIYVGEFVSPPLEYDKVEKWMNDFYPLSDEVNDSQGCHVHISFKKKEYYEIAMRQPIHDAILDEIRRLGKELQVSRKNFWHRLEEGSTYCNRSYKPEKQNLCTSKGDGRYTQINYCYNLRTTMEIRVLPMFKEKKVIIKLIMELLKFIDNLIIQNPLNLEVLVEEIHTPKKKKVTIFKMEA